MTNTEETQIGPVKIVVHIVKNVKVQLTVLKLKIQNSYNQTMSQPPPIVQLNFTGITLLNNVKNAIIHVSHVMDQLQMNV